MPIRLAVRGLLLHESRLLLVNAYKGRGDLWCAPGGGVEPHTSLPDNLSREIHEETGLTVAVGAPALVNEFHDPENAFHQIEITFRCTLVDGDLNADWTDPEGIVTQRRWVTREQAATLRIKPDTLPKIAWGDAALSYDPLEPILR